MLEFTKHSPQAAFRRVENDLRMLNSNINMNRFKAMNSNRLGEEIARLRGETKAIMRESRYGSWLKDTDYVQKTLMIEALELLREYRKHQEETEVLVPGLTYYRSVKQFGNILEGYRCHYLPESTSPNWVPFRENIVVEKALTVLRYGDESDFKRIYVEMADGVMNPFKKVCLEHITESSKDALKQIEEYCDTRWRGPSPWAVRAPFKLKNMIEESDMNRKNSITEMHGRFKQVLDMLREGEMEQYEVVNMVRDMMKQVDNMVSDLGKISSNGIEASAGARAVLGDQQAQSIEQALGDPVRQAADSLSQLKASLQQAIQSLESGVSGGDADGGMNMDGPKMGADADPDMADDMADVNLDGQDGERPMKGM